MYFDLLVLNLKIERDSHWDEVLFNVCCNQLSLYKMNDLFLLLVVSHFFEMILRFFLSFQNLVTIEVNFGRTLHFLHQKFGRFFVQLECYPISGSNIHNITSIWMVFVHKLNVSKPFTYTSIDISSRIISTWKSNELMLIHFKSSAH